MDVYEQDRQRILSIKRGAEVAQRVQDDLAVRAALALEQERIAAAQAQAQAQEKEHAESVAVEAEIVKVLAPLAPRYAERKAAGDEVIKAVSHYLALEDAMNPALREAGELFAHIEYKIEPTDRAKRRASLRQRSGLPMQHTDGLPVATDHASAAGRLVCYLLSSKAIDGATVTIGGHVLSVD